MSLLMLPFEAFKFLWANSIVLKHVGEVQIRRWLIYIAVKLYSNIYLIHVMGILKFLKSSSFRY